MMTVKLSLRESAIETELIRRVRAAGGRADKLVWQGRRGFFDRLVVLPGNTRRWHKTHSAPPRIIFCELKRPRGGVISPNQVILHDAYRRLGCEVAIVRTFEDIDRLLEPPKSRGPTL